MDSKSLLDRLVEATQAIDKVKKTGRAAANQGGGAAYSIEDLEETVGEAIADAGVICGHSFNQLSVVDERGEEGRNKLWLADINYELRAPGDDLVLSYRLMDIGTSPSSAVSYCIKRWQRGFGHVTTDQGQPEARPSWQPYEHGTAGPIPCPNPAHEKVTGNPPTTPGLRVSRDNPSESYCWKKANGCGWSGPTPKPGRAPAPSTGELSPSQTSQETREAYVEQRKVAQVAPQPDLPARDAKRSAVGPTPRTRQAPSAPAIAIPPPGPAPSPPAVSDDPGDFPPIDTEEAPPAEAPATPEPAPPSAGYLVDQYADAIEVTKTFEGKVVKVKVDETVSDGELTKMVFTHAVELKRLQLLEKSDPKADYSGYVAQEAKRGLDSYCEKKYGHQFAQSSNDECQEMIANFIGAIIGYGGKGVK